MRFPKVFTRTKSGSGIALGSDVAPTASPGVLTDNILTSGLASINGWPVQRIVVAYNYTGGGSAPTLMANLYFWEDQTQAWYKINAAPVSIPPGVLTFFDAITMSGTSQRYADLVPQTGLSASPGALECCLVPIAAGTEPAGTYTFAMGCDLTTVGT